MKEFNLENEVKEIKEAIEYGSEELNDRLKNIEEELGAKSFLSQVQEDWDTDHKMRAVSRVVLRAALTGVAMELIGRATGVRILQPSQGFGLRKAPPTLIMRITPLEQQPAALPEGGEKEEDIIE